MGAPEKREILDEKIILDKREKWGILDPSKHRDFEKLRERTWSNEYPEYGKKLQIFKVKQYKLYSIKHGNNEISILISLF